MRSNRHRNGGVYDRSTFKIWIVIALVLSFITMDILLNTTVEEMKRDQARYNLKQIKYCYKANIAVMTQKMTLDVCTNKSKTSFTGDVYVLDGDSLEFVHETSRDVPRNIPSFFTEDSIGKLFRDWDSGQKAIDIIVKGKDSERGLNTSYNFDGETEWIEWIYLPDEFGDLQDRRLIAVQGTQKDEVMQYFSSYRYTTMSLTALISFLLLAEQGSRRKDEYR